jgi:outer membrane immunogenic protein
MMEKSMTRLLTASFAALAVVVAGAASAADLPVRPAPPARAPVYVAPIYNWTGFYIGANGGWGQADNCWTSLVLVSDGCHKPTGGLAGGQLGFNWQLGGLVLGIELAGDWTSLKKSNLAPAGTFTDRSTIDAISSVTGRLGYAMDAVMLYGKGGGAFVNDKFERLDAAGAVVLSSASGTRTGWTAGAGIEWGFASNWSLGFEYDHYDFGSKNVTFTSVLVLPNSGFTDHIKQTVDTATVRLNWRFGGGNSVVARY